MKFNRVIAILLILSIVFTSAPNVMQASEEEPKAVIENQQMEESVPTIATPVVEPTAEVVPTSIVPEPTPTVLVPTPTTSVLTPTVPVTTPEVPEPSPTIPVPTPEVSEPSPTIPVATQGVPEPTPTVSTATAPVPTPTVPIPTLPALDGSVNKFDPLLLAGFTNEMLLIAAFYDSTFNDLLDQNSLFAMLDLNEQTIYNMMSAMSVDQLELMNKLVPATYQSYYRRKNPEKFKDFLRKQSNDPVVENNKEENGLEVRSFANLMASNGKYTEIENKFKYTKNTHDTYDPMLRTSAQRVVDVFLPGKRGLDFELVRSYNSLNAKTETQRSHRPWSYPEGAAEYHPIANSPDGVLYEDYHNLGDGRNSIAAGWQFNIPYMNSYPEMPFHSKHQITVEQAKNSTNIPSKYGQYIYYNMSDHGANYIKRDVSFTLEDGTTYEFNNGIKDRSYNYPDRNVKYTEINALNGTVYLLVLDDQITYNFFKSRDESYGPISSKSNIYGDTIRYGGTSVEMPYTEHRLFTRIITDSVGRKIEITMPSDPLKRPETRLVVKGKDGSILKDLKYNSIQTYRDYVMVPTKYSYLVSVVDQLTNKTLQSYTYYDMANWFAEYNMEDDYYADTEGNYNVIFDGGHENSKIMVNDSRTWGYNNFLLLKEVKDESGFSIHYQYKYHDEKWTNYVNGRLSFRELDTMRGSMRLYNDPHVLTYTGYHPVTSIFYTYTNADGQPKLFEQELQKDPNTSNEIWNRPKSGGELGDFRLSRVDSYRSGDKILTKITSKYEGYTDTKTLRFQAACKRIPSTFVVSS